MYKFKHLPIPGGGFITGCVYHKNEKGLVYIRTDIGGAYRLDTKTDSWKCLCHKAGIDTLCLTSPLSIAVSDGDPDLFYMACGMGKKGFLAASRNKGESFILREIPASINGNERGRGTGERLIKTKRTLFFASQGDGLLASDDEGVSWYEIEADGNKHFTFISEVADGIIILGAKNNSDSLLASYDGGKSFTAFSVPSGFVPVRCAFGGEFLYVCFNQLSEKGFYACDSARIENGLLFRYKLDKGAFSAGKNITPRESFLNTADGYKAAFGFGGLAADKNGRVALATICCTKGDRIMVSDNNGESWKSAIHRDDLASGSFSAPYMKPEYNGGTTMLHWITDIALNPFEDGEAIFNTGTGIFKAKNLWEKAFYRDFCDGIEETVHINVYAPPKGDVLVLDAVGDLGGFAFTQLEKPCENSFTDENNNRYITVMNIDFPDGNPSFVAATPRGNWTGSTKGGVIISVDGGKSWTHTAQPSGLSEYIDKLVDKIEKPNVNSGWVAVSADGSRLVQTLCDGSGLSSGAAVFSTNKGKSWKKCAVYDLWKNTAEENTLFKVYSDRVCGKTFYAFGKNSVLYVSCDGGESFFEHKADLPKINLGLVFSPQIRFEYGKKGVCWLALREHGLYKLVYDAKDNRFESKRVTKENESVYAVGIGKESFGSPFHTLFVSAVINGQFGLWRSFNEGRSWEKISGEKNTFGFINSISGDMRTFGRFYMGTASFGLICGDEDFS